MAKDRTILYVQKVINDPGNSKAAAEQIRHFKEIETAAKAATKSMDEARAASSKMAGGGTSASRRSSRGGFNAGYDRAAAAEERAIAREREINLRQRIRGVELEERASAKAAAAIKRHNNELNAGLKQVASGVGSVARAFVLLGVSGEENLERAVRAFAKFEAGMQGIQGAANIVSGGSKAFRAYRGLSAGSGLAAGIGAVGAGSAVLAGGAALAVGGGIGFGIGRAAIGGDSFGRMTDNWGLTNYAGERRAAVQGRNATRANQWIAQRSGVDQRFADFNSMQEINLQHAEATGGLRGAREQAMTNADAAFAQSQEVRARVSANPGMAREVAAREMAQANASQVQAMSTLVGLRQQELSIVNQALSAEKQRTQAIKDQQQAVKASVGAADIETIRLADEAAKNRRLGKMNTPAQAGALGSILGNVGQEEFAKIGENNLRGRPELAALIDSERRKSEQASKAISVAVQQSITGRLTIVPDLEKLKTDIEVIAKQWNTEYVELLKKQLELNNADRDSQDSLRRRTNGSS